MEVFAKDFEGREEPAYAELMDLARPYLPNTGVEGEMVMSVGKVSYLARKGADGIVDISPFTCMNGIVSEAIYPRLSHDLGGIPISQLLVSTARSRTWTATSGTPPAGAATRKNSTAAAASVAPGTLGRAS